MGANIVKLNQCFRAVGSFLVNVLTLRFPLWLYIVACLAAVLFFCVVSCSSKHKDDVNSAVVGFTEYAGHRYLVFAAQDIYDGSFSVVHDPDCICYYLDDSI